MKTSRKLTLPLALASAFFSASGQSKQPNIVWISCEDMSPRLGCWGDPVANTPNIDRLASEGVRFTNVFTAAAISAPVRSGLITGMYHTTIGTHHMRTISYPKNNDEKEPYAAVPPHYVKSFTEYLRANGYYCTNNSKTDYQMQVDFGDRYTPPSMWNETGTSAHFRNRKTSGQPFFAVFNFTITHESQSWNTGDLDTDPAKVEVPPYYPDTELVRKQIARQYDNIHTMDKMVGEIMQQLAEEGLLENTVVFFWSDHGDGFPRAKRWLYDSGTHVPLIVRWPGKLPSNNTDDRLISSIDFGPTVLSIADVEVPSHMQGIPFLGNQTGKKRPYVFGAKDREDENYDMIRSVRNKNFLYIRNFYPAQPYVGLVAFRNRAPIMQELYRLQLENRLTSVQQLWMSSSPRPAEELYDVKKDPHQINNLASNPKYKKVLERMRSEQTNWSKRTNDLGHMNESEMIRRMWPDGVQPPTEKPAVYINSPGNPPLTAKETGGAYRYPSEAGLRSVTQGASIVYTFDEGDNARWELYTGMIPLPLGKSLLRAKATRYGYKISEEVRFEFTVTEN